MQQLYVAQQYSYILINYPNLAVLYPSIESHKNERIDFV